MNGPMDINRIMELIPHRYPFLLVDKIIEYKPGQWIKGLKNVTMNEPFFQGHFPGHPIMPGVLIIESMAQVGAVMMMLSADDPDKILLYFRRINRAKFKRPVIPGDCLIQELTLLKERGGIWKFEAVSFVDENLVASAELEAAVVPR